MKFRTDLMFSAVCAAVLMTACNAFAISGRLSPQDFNKMYYLAQNGKVGILRDAVNRGLNIDATNPNGDTGLCIAVKRKDHVAYNSFRMSGANPRHQCTYRIYKEYQEFLDSSKTSQVDRIVGNEESLYYQEEKRSWWPWLLGGALIGGGAWALGGGGGGDSESDSTIISDKSEYGLTGVVNDYYRLVSGSSANNSLNLDGSNPDAGSVVRNIKLLPNVLNNDAYLRSYIKIINGGSFTNSAGGHILLGDAAIGMSAYDKESKGFNDGSIEITAQNGAVGMAASNGAEITNNPSGGIGKIDLAFTGGKEGDAIIGMYADTNSRAINYGVINGTTTKISGSTDDSEDVDVSDSAEGGESGSDTGRVTSANSGTILGMGVFDFYTGKDHNTSIVSAQNYGSVSLSAGYNAAADVSVNLVGMGSYIDDAFLHGASNPAFAEQMQLDNFGDIALKYIGKYNVSDTALKFGDGGLIGMRADASTVARNEGNIDIKLTSTQLTANTDVAAGMLSVHGAELVNGVSNDPYNGVGNTGGTIRIVNEANSGGVSYGMLAAKGDGTQTKIYNWKAPKLYNHGFIDLQASNSYAMASFAGGEIVNNGVINLGKIPNDDSGASYYKNNYALYGSGGADTSSVTLTNNGIINVYAINSTAIYNAFAGAVTVENNGKIYFSTKATDSSAMGGDFSKAVNRGIIEYKVGGSENAAISGITDEPGFSTSIPLKNAVVVVGKSNKKQTFVNEETGQIIIGDEINANQDYGATYVTAGVRVMNQGTASNKGLIKLVKYDKDTTQVNAAMWLDDSTSNESYIRNQGSIIVDALNSIGMRNASTNNAEATNYGHIVVNGNYGYGMSTLSANIFNGRELSHTGDSTVLRAKTIDVNGRGAAAMYIETGTGYNYGDIFINGKDATAVILKDIDDDINHFYNYGNIYFSGAEGQIYYWLDDSKESFEIFGVVDKFTFAKLTDGSEAIFRGNVSVFGKNSRLFVVDGSTVINDGDVTVTDDAIAIEVAKDAKDTEIVHQGLLTVGDSESSATGIYARSGATVNLNNNVVVENGTGVIALNGAEVTNAKLLNVKQGVGLDISGVNKKGKGSKGTNSGRIIVSGDDNIGVKLSYGVEFENKDGDIRVSGNAIGVLSKANWSNDGNITVSDTATGVEVQDGTFNNGGDIVLNSAGTYAIYNNGGSSVNGGTISGKGTAVYHQSGSFSNTGKINLSNGTGILANSDGVSNSGKIVIGTGTGAIVDGGYIANSGEINVSDGVGIKVDAGDALNSGDITVSKGSGMQINNGTGSNSGTITAANGKGMEILSGSGVNNGNIVTTTGYGMYVNGENAKGLNTADIKVMGSGTGAHVEKGTFTNAGTITFNSDLGGSCVSGDAACGKYVDEKKEEKKEEAGSGAGTDSGGVAPAAAMALSKANHLVYVGKDAQFVNKGEVDLGSQAIDFDDMRDETGSYVIAKKGTFKADSFKGDVVAGKDIVMNGFEDAYMNKNSFVGKDEGVNITSQSYLFTAEAKDNGDVVDIELNRKKFEEVVDEEDLAAFWEGNYQLQHNEKMYNALKSAETAEEFDEIKTSESGKNFYANLQRENMAVLRGLNTQEQNRILENGLDGIYTGMDYYRTGKDATGNLSGYADNVYSPYIGYGNKLNRNWSVGGTLRAAYVDAEYDEAYSNRSNKILLATLPVLYQSDDFKFLMMPSVGVGFGEYERQALSGSYKADMFDVYYGIYNHAEYSVDLKVAELVMDAELNLQGSSMSKADEDNEGLNLRSNNSLSLESGFGVKLRKRIALAKQRSLMLAVGMKYYHEFLDPYKDLTVGMNGSPVNYKVNGYNEKKDRIRTSAEAVYKDGDFSVAAEIAHNIEKENNVEGGIGVRYDF